MKAYRTLRDLNFDKIISEAQAQTSTGSSMLNTFKSAVMRQPVTHALVNSFLAESKNYRYDNGVTEAATKVASYINDNQYSWQLATACESIHASGSRYNTLNENAANQVENLIDMDENDVVSYVKAGALKNVMFVESFRRIARSIFRSMPVVEINENFTAVHPISVTEMKGESTFFSVLGHLFECKGDEIHEAKWSEVSEDFRQMTSALFGKNTKIVNEAVVYDCAGKFTYTVTEKGKAVKESNGNKYELTAEQLRENNSLYLSTLIPGRRQQVAAELEAIAKICENFDSVNVLDNVSVYTTSRDRFVVAENNGNAVAFLVESAKKGNAWSVSDNIANVVEFLKKQTSTDLTEQYKPQIEKLVESQSEEEKAAMAKRLQEDGIEARKRKIAELTEQYKNDPARLMILAKLAEDLNSISE